MEIPRCMILTHKLSKSTTHFSSSGPMHWAPTIFSSQRVLSHIILWIWGDDVTDGEDEDKGDGDDDDNWLQWLLTDTEINIFYIVLQEVVTVM